MGREYVDWVGAIGEMGLQVVDGMRRRRERPGFEECTIVFGNGTAPILWAEYDNGGCMLREKVHSFDICVTVKPFETLAEISTTFATGRVRTTFGTEEADGEPCQTNNILDGFVNVGCNWWSKDQSFTLNP